MRAWTVVRIVAWLHATGVTLAPSATTGSRGAIVEGCAGGNSTGNETVTPPRHDGPMRILHTSDWHLGRSFGDHRLLEQQALFIDWLVDLVRHEEIDLVAIAGDLYDRSVPPADAVELFHSSLSRLLAAGADVAAIAGNHDSAERLGSIDGLLTVWAPTARGLQARRRCRHSHLCRWSAGHRCRALPRSGLRTHRYVPRSG